MGITNMVNGGEICWLVCTCPDWVSICIKDGGSIYINEFFIDCEGDGKSVLYTSSYLRSFSPKGFEAKNGGLP
jgi:hypothetical protein